MIDLYTFTTPNGRKVSILLEELGISYNVHKIDITQGQQFSPDFVEINPNSKIPAIIDHETEITVFESGAILMYLAEKTGKLLPRETKSRYQVIEWLMFQMASVGPMFGQFNHFNRFAPEKVPYAIARYEQETLRLYGVLDGQLADRSYIAGEDYSIADIALYPWVASYEFMGLTLEKHPHLKRWVEILQERPAVQRGMAVPA
ncbi:glutathione binding-like protein [Laspinema olomoucense]|uniref:Glutathione S-transferase N-terminal domain-containing protein n=1 Tax=Laspinema olomoucense D3b TaxID=2953688 RepID=A0ABT2N518_9CYAN|nr:MULTISPECIES: glutathione binding-like protein [unclassified Laspinema]MCT7972005.1 glutathione S-transferase N-terminal domain-containing protein [Laspinema sp. D3d]MCT7976475.1 glutathione S-transferase N-terminal domain-containing protein [Laspinema sp. D3b]MCT7990051.1 glutathione S-transferase N-terminal domain-containing protein [Laspinema sp. D3a]MCT7994539.1 glutathione S-transferase N-terminal domain-containing protein [Laspinema sp. D3c]